MHSRTPSIPSMRNFVRSHTLSTCAKIGILFATLLTLIPAVASGANGQTQLEIVSGSVKFTVPVSVSAFTIHGKAANLSGSLWGSQPETAFGHVPC